MTITEGEYGEPFDREGDLPPDIEKALKEFLEGVETHSSLLDCYWGELYGAINANQWAGTITPEFANHLRRRYLFNFGEEE